MKQKNLKWKQKWLDDRSGCWYSAKVPIIGWEYIIDCSKTNDELSRDVYQVGVFWSSNDSDVTLITKQTYRTKESAMNTCEKHLNKMLHKFYSWFKKN